MIRFLIYSVLLLSLPSCRTYNMLDGKSKPVFFTPDSSVFNDLDFPKQEIIYFDLLGARGNFPNIVELKNGETAEAIIHQPTFFIVYDDFLVYPGERIIIKKSDYTNYSFLKIHGSRRRNRELSFFKTFHEIEQFPVLTRIENPSLDTILNLEKKLKGEVPQLAITSRLLFDSLIKACRVSGKFKRITKSYTDNRYSLSLFDLYKIYKDTLQANSLYEDKCKQLISLFNGITERSKFGATNTYIVFNELADEVLPYKIWKIKNENEFQSCFDSVKNNFNNLARNYLLSQLMYAAYQKRIQVSSQYLEKYEVTCSDKTYKKLVHNVISQRQQNDNEAIRSGDNSILSVDGKLISSLENILAKYKGKLVFIDFWATWCAPCREEMPYLEKIVQASPKDKIVFLSISIDKETQPWQKAVIANNSETNNNFLLVDHDKSSFVQQNNINSIPRYMLFDTSGKIINADAPRPSDLKLKELLDKYLQQ